MAAGGQRTIKIRFTGDSKDLDRTAKNAEHTLKKFDDSVESSRRGFAGKIGAVVEQVGEKLTKGLGVLSEKLPGVLGGAVSALPPQGQAVALALVAGLAVSLAPLLATAVSTAVLMGVGGGVLAMGIKAASNDPQVKTAFGALTDTARNAFKGLGDPFVDPLVRAAKTFQGTVESVIGPSLKRMGAIMAPVIDKLAPNLDKFFRNVMPGVEKAVKASAPLFDKLAEHLPKIGEAIGSFFESISENGDDATTFFGDLLTAIELLIIGLGKVIGWLASMYGTWRDGIVKTRELMLRFTLWVIEQFRTILAAASASLSWIPGLGPKLKAAEAKFADFQRRVNNELHKIKPVEVTVTITAKLRNLTGSKLGDSALNSAFRKNAEVSGARAGGGPVAAGRSYLVGEKGPEILTMGSQGGHITPNHALGGGGVESLNLTLDLGEGIRQVVQVNLREHDRQMKRTMTARRGLAY